MEPITVEWKHANKDRGREQPWHPCGILRCMSLARANPTFNSRHDMSVRLQVCANPVLEVHHKVLRNQCDWIPWNWPARQTFTKLWHALMLQCRKYQETWRNHVEGRSRLFKASAPHLFFRVWMGSILPKLLEVASERFLTLRCSDDANNWNWRHAMTSLNSRRQAVPKIFIFVCVEHLKRCKTSNRLSILNFWFFKTNCCSAGGMRPSCARMPTKLCMMVEAGADHPGVPALLFQISAMGRG